MTIKTVHIVFKTHLDVGFTDLAENVVARYFGTYIPGALALAEALRREGGPERFVWTTGSWLIYEYLEQADPEARRRMEDAIRRGDIAWHGLPFTTLTEAMDAELFRFGLSLSRKLDARYGRETIAAKMTDVPGHTRAIVPLMAEAGVTLLHIGVNSASSAPEVPPAFVWRSPDGAEIIVLYSAGGYGTLHVIEGLDEALFIAHTNDNLGPPSVRDVLQVFDDMRREFPGAEVRASTLDAFARSLGKIRASLPIVTAEIGDTWIYGIGSDPTKVSQYRELLRLRRAWQQRDVDAAAFDAFSRHLLVVPEHTCGLDEKTFLGDYAHYATADFAVARKRDVVDADAVPEAFAGLAHHAHPGNTYSRFESSWQEQRDYLTQAVASLDDPALREEAKTRLRGIEPRCPNHESFARLDLSTSLSSPVYDIAFDPDNGSLTRLVDRAHGRTWCTPDHPIGLFRYESFAQADYDRWMRDYVINMERTADWAIPDFSKPGMDKALPRPEHRLYAPQLREALSRDTADGLDIILALGLPDVATSLLGAPRHVRIAYRFEPRDIDIRVEWFGKQACRLPEAIWFSFAPLIASPTGWMMDKMGQWISPLDVARNGGRNLHGIGWGVRIRDGADALGIESLDAPLVAPGDPRLLHFDNAQPRLEHGMHFNLYNNLWCSNFPMWYEEDASFRFAVTFSDSGGEDSR